jgi:hypothetical protein
MTTGNFEVSLPTPATLTGEIYAEVYEVAGAKPTTIIRTDQEWGVKIHWDLKGPLQPYICGEWCLHLFLESMGPGPELKLEPYPYMKVPLDPCGDGEYNFDFRVPVGTVDGRHCSNPYKLVVAVSYITPCGKPGPIAGFVEGAILQFYEAQ